MTKHTVAESGYYDGKFLHAGESYHDDGLDNLSHGELVAYARDHEIAVDEGEAPLVILNAIRAAEAAKAS